MKKNIWFEICIHLWITIVILPVVIWACFLSAKSILMNFPENVYQAYAKEFYK